MRHVKFDEKLITLVIAYFRQVKMEKSMVSSLKFVLIALLLAVGNLSVIASAQELSPPKSLINSNVIKDIKSWLNNPVVDISINSQNKKYSTLTNAQILTFDKQWRAERKNDDQPLIAAILSSPLSNYLTQIQAASGGLLTEIFVMDAKGLNVGQSAITSDFWQGDEAKFQKTFGLGKDQIFVDDPEFHKESGTWRVQVNLTLSNNQNQPVGAITVEYNLTELNRRNNLL